MNMNENIIMKMVENRTVDNKLSYEVFDKIFSFLPLEEQYKVTDVLAAHGIELMDEDDLSLAYIVEFIDEGDSGEIRPLYDNNIFGGNDPRLFPSSAKKGAYWANEMLAKAAQEGNEEAMEKLFQDNERLVWDMVYKYNRIRGNKLTEEDLFMEGVQGLMKAVKRFDYSRGWKFSTYAEWWIRQAIYRAIQNNGYTIRIPVHKQDQIRKVMLAYNEMCDLGVTPGERIPAIVNALTEKGYSISEKQVMECIRLRDHVQGCVSLNAAVGEDSESELADFVPAADRSANPESLLDQIALKYDMQGIISQLNTRERMIIVQRFGLDGLGIRTLEDVGRDMGVTRERMRQIEKKALRKLHSYARRAQMEEYLMAQ